MATWPQYYAVNMAPYNVGGPVDNAILQKAIEAEYFPTSLIWFPTKAASQTWAKAKGGGNSAGVPGTGALNNAANTTTNAVSSLSAFQQAITNFLQDFTQENTWLRIGEGVIGIVLIAAGVSHLTGLSKVAATAAKAAVVA